MSYCHPVWRVGFLLDPGPRPRPGVSPKRVGVSVAGGAQESFLPNPIGMAIAEGLIVPIRRAQRPPRTVIGGPMFLGGEYQRVIRR